MSVPRLVLCGLEPGPAVPLAAGALVSCLASRHTVRPVSVGLDLPLWRLLYGAGAKAPRVLDPALYHKDVAAELFDSWSESCDMTILVAAEPALDRWQGVKGSRPVDIAAAYDAPVVLVLDARDRGPTAAAAVCGVQALARKVEFAGVIVVGGDEAGPAAELGRVVEHAGLPVLGWIPPQLSEQFARQYSASPTGLRQIGPRPVKGHELRLCAEAATYLHADELEAAATRRGYVPAGPRRLLTPLPAASGLRLCVGWGAPLEPLALENIDVLQALGLELAPLNIGRDRELPPDISGLLLMGQLDEDELPAFAQNGSLLEALAAAIGDGLPTLALGGGALLLLRRLADSHGRSHELAGVLPAEAELLEWYERPRYVRARAGRANPFDVGENVLCELFDLEFLLLEQDTFAYHVGEPGEAGQAEGFALGRCLATTLYPSLALRPAMAASFVDAMRSAGPRP
jgi:cobyrinic acid a,c-diamide synthase